MSNKDAISRAIETHKRVSRDLTKAAVDAFMANLGVNSCPTLDEIQSALENARRKLVDGLFHRDKMFGLFEGDGPDDVRLAAIRLQLNAFTPKMNCPPFPAYSEISPLRLGLTALLGTVVGLMVGSPVGIYLLASRDTGLVLGAPLGAFLITWAVVEASRSKALSDFLIWALMSSTVAEAWAFLSSNPVTAIWNRLSGQSGRGVITRIGIYSLLILTLIFTRRREILDRSILESTVREFLDQWLYGTLIVVALLGEKANEGFSDGNFERKAIAELGRRMIELHSASAVALPGVAEDVIETARAAGFEGLDGHLAFGSDQSEREEQLLEWDEPMRERFNAFGHIEAGDMVRVEQEPVIRNGEILQKGLVRKKRGS